MNLHAHLYSLGLIRVLDTVELQIRQYQPCEARNKFDGNEVVCEVLRGYHTDTHQSSKTHIVSRPVWLLGWLGIRKHIEVACRWEGAYIADAETTVRFSEVGNTPFSITVLLSFYLFFY